MRDCLKQLLFYTATKTFLLLLICSSPLQAEIQVSARTVDYDGSRVNLDGDVLIDHEMGKMSALEAYFYRLPDEEEDFSILRLEGNVHIALPDGALLRCDIAEFNGTKKTGTFTNKSGLVNYSTHAMSSGGKSSPLKVEGKQMRVRMGKQLQELGVEREVCVHYNNKLTAKSDKLWFEPKEGQKGSCGTFHMEMQDDHQCEVDTENGDHINARKIHLHTENESISFDEADGDMCLRNGEHLYFRSEKLDWTEKKQHLTMKGKVLVHQKSMGKLTSDRSLEVDLENGEMGKQLKKMKTLGKTILSYIDEETGENTTVICYGEVLVDHKNLKTTLSSPKINGKVPANKRVTYRDRTGHVTADEIILWYHDSEPRPTLARLELSGDVYMLNDAPWNPSDDKQVRQYALAERVEYDPATRIAKLASKAPARVLFFDEIKNFQVSAPSLEAWRDGTSGKEAVRGHGDVRFSLIESEIEQMERLFKIHNVVEKDKS